MAGFIYFLPGAYRPVLAPEHIPPECELSSQAKGASISYRECFRGPGADSGVLFSFCDRDLSFHEESQSWTPVTHEGKICHWVGFDKDDRPKPADLGRNKVTDGSLVTLGDGNQWLIPSVHVSGNTLPKAYRFIDGQLRLVTIGGYEDVIDDADRWFTMLTSLAAGEEVKYNASDLFKFMVKLLAVNYRVGPYECACGLDLFTSSSEQIVSVLDAAFGIDAIRHDEEVKKKAVTV